MAGEAAVYRSSRLQSINPTAAVSEDTSYLYTLVRRGRGVVVWRCVGGSRGAVGPVSRRRMLTGRCAPVLPLLCRL